jgi:hypothetical protein
MAKTWKLDTETKGTGAAVVPLRPERPREEAKREPIYVPPKPRARPEPPPEPRAPRRFRVMDVESRRLLADGADLRTTLDVLGGVRSSVDVRVEVLQPQSRRWRPLTLAEQRGLWERRTVRRAG